MQQHTEVQFLSFDVQILRIITRRNGYKGNTSQNPFEPFPLEKKAVKKDNRVDEISSFLRISSFANNWIIRIIFEFGMLWWNCISSKSKFHTIFFFFFFTLNPYKYKRRFSTFFKPRIVAICTTVVRARILPRKYWRFVKNIGNSKVGAFFTDYEKIFLLFARLSWRYVL